MKWVSLLMMTIMIAMTNAIVMIKEIFHIGNDNDDAGVNKKPFAW